jgi:hypothetical protein
MATKKVIYLLAGTVPTIAETAEITRLNALALPAYDVFVRNGPQAELARKEDCDYYAGTVTSAYAGDEPLGYQHVDKPLLLVAAPGTVSVATSATIQLHVSAVTGASLDALASEDVTASTAGTTYASDDEAVASVSAEGVVTGVGASGTCVVTVTHEYATGKTVTLDIDITVT